MKHFSPEAMPDHQILARFQQARQDSELIEIVLSAIYYSNTAFAGRLLLSAFEKIGISHRHYLGNVACTFIQMHKTDFLADAILVELRRDTLDPKVQAENIDAIEELRTIFAGRSTHLHEQ